jgi:hypothetical protein
MTREQTSFMIAMLIKPFAVFAVLAALLCVRYAVIKYLPSGRLKRLLLIRLDKAGRRRACRSPGAALPIHQGDHLGRDHPGLH